MSQDTPNPFALPGMSAGFMNPSTNPLLTSMDMMRQAMASMGYGDVATSGEPMANPMAPQELEKRIGELRVVENWLKLNLSMLTSTIQGMEVQLATVKTLQSFVAMGQTSTADDPQAASPLEIALGLKPAPAKPRSAPKAKPQSSDSDAGGNTSAAAPPTDLQQAAAQNWWKMLEGQFAQIAAATTNAAQMTSDALGQATEASTGSKKPAATKTATKSVNKKTVKTTRAAKSRSS